MNIDKALEQAIEKGAVKSKSDLADKLWPEKSPANKQVSIGRLLSGKYKKYDEETILRLCKILQTTPNYLFNF